MRSKRGPGRGGAVPRARGYARRVAAGALLLVLACAGCSDTATEELCGAGLRAVGTACVPALDDCADGEVPLPGGGCKRVGLEECAGGIKGPPDWTCKRIGLEECAGGIKGPPDWTCKAIGPPSTCATGWTKVSGGWCEPILPSGACGESEMEVIGQATCQGIGSCGSGTWGGIQTTSRTIFVDAAYAGGGSDGSQAKPFTTISAALAKATRTARHVAVAAGEYGEDLTLDVASLTLEGRCAKLVKVKGQSASSAVSVSAGGVTLRGLTVTGPADGVTITGTRATLDRVAVQGCGKVGLVVQGEATIKDTLLRSNAERGGELHRSSRAALERVVVDNSLVSTASAGAGNGIKATEAEVSLKDSVVSGSKTLGLNLFGATVTLERTIIRRTRLASTGNGGYGIQAGADASATRPTRLTLKDCLVAEDENAGATLHATDTVIERSVIRGAGSAGSGGYGAVWAQSDQMPGKPEARRLAIRDSLITDTRARYGAVNLFGYSATLERIRVLSTSGAAGFGVVAAAELGSGPGELPSALTARDILVSKSTEVGVLVMSSSATLERAVIKETQPGSLDRSGHGIQVTLQSGAVKPASVLVKDSLVFGNGYVGVQVFSSNITLERTIVRGTRPSRAGDGGGGIMVTRYPLEQGPTVASKVAIKDSLVAENHSAGMVLYSSEGTVERTVVRDTKLEPSTQKYGLGIGIGAKPGLSHPSKLTVKDCLLSRNRFAGIQIASSSAIVERTVVRQTAAQPDGRFGDGFSVLVDPLLLKAASLELKESVVESSARHGISLHGSSATVERTVVTQGATAPGGSGPAYGVSLREEELPSKGKLVSKLNLRDSRMLRARGAGILVSEGSRATIERCAVVDARALQQGFGDGIAVEGSGTSLTLSYSLVAGSARAGLLFDEAGGSVSGSAFVSGVLSIALQNGADPEIAADNAYQENQQNALSTGGNLKVSAAPEVPTLYTPK